jgi:hypothetical protein
LLVSAIIISGCVSNPVSSKSSSNDGVEKLSIQGISDEGLYSKVDDDMGLYDINFYKISDSSVVGYALAEKYIIKKARMFCGDKKRSAFLGDRVKPEPLPIKAGGSIGAFSDDASLVFVCKDSQFTKDNINIVKRIDEYFDKFNEEYPVLMQRFQVDQARYHAIGDSISNAINKANEDITKGQMEIYKEQMRNRPIDTSCTVIGNQVNCSSY